MDQGNAEEVARSVMLWIIYLYEEARQLPEGAHLHQTLYGIAALGLVSVGVILSLKLSVRWHKLCWKNRLKFIIGILLL
jgi:hypothetical protein